MMELTADHLVINTRYSLESYAREFAGLGFTVTPVSRHTLGSENRSIVFKGHYLELAGLGDGKRKDLLESREGIDGLVFRMDDPAAVQRKLDGEFLSSLPLQHFSRPAGGGEAKFSVIRLRPGQFPEGRVYFCKHLTPELIWREEDMQHANGAIGISRLFMVSPAPDAARTRYERLGKLTGLSLEFLSDNEWRERFKSDAPIKEGFVALAFKVNDFNKINKYIKSISKERILLETDSLVRIRTEKGIILEFEP